MTARIMVKYPQMKFAVAVFFAFFSFSALAAARVVVPSLPEPDAPQPRAADKARRGAAEIRRETQHETRRKWYNVKHEEPRKFNPRPDARYRGRSGLSLAF